MGARIVVGGVFCHPIGNGSAEVDYVVLKKARGFTTRFKRPTDGWQLLVLTVRGHTSWDVTPGVSFFAPVGSVITQYLTRLA